MLSGVSKRLRADILYLGASCALICSVDYVLQYSFIRFLQLASNIERRSHGSLLLGSTIIALTLYAYWVAFVFASVAVRYHRRLALSWGICLVARCGQRLIHLFGVNDALGDWVNRFVAALVLLHLVFPMMHTFAKHQHRAHKTRKRI